MNGAACLSTNAGRQVFAAVHHRMSRRGAMTVFGTGDRCDITGLLSADDAVAEPRTNRGSSRDGSGADGGNDVGGDGGGGNGGGD